MRTIKQRYGPPVMKALGVREPADLAAAARYRASPTVSCSTPSRRRAPPCPAATALPSTGAILEDFEPGLPFLLSGGLDAEMSAKAIRMARAPGVDVSSGVETAPGVKDPALIRAFIAAARARGGASAGEDVS